MRILVLSDSHSGLAFMRYCLDAVSPSAIVHLGDYYQDAETIHEEYPMIPLYQVPGNCDMYRCPPFAREVLILPVCGVPLYMTHGHRHQVKMTTSMLLRDARESKVAAVLYGHTHAAECYRDQSGLWVMNPGSCCSWGGTVGVIETEGNQIKNCRILTMADMEEMK